METFDLTPDPKVLIALTHTPLQPLDALCELIDNAIDSFEAARLQGNPVSHPLIIVDLPGRSEVEKGEGLVRIRDNGRGLTREQAQMALRAGYSGNNPYDNLGLFGMGFNIATGKIGRTTRFLTGRVDDNFCIETVINLVAMQRARSYDVPVHVVPKPAEFEHGTLVEIRDWWPVGDANEGFVRKLAGYPKSTVRAELGRRYASILRKGLVRIVVNNDPCSAFEHCVWDDARSVERRGIGQIPAVFRIDHALGSQMRCAVCTAKLGSQTKNCPACGSSSFRTIEERIRGWVGIQRFDDQTEFGIDLIRNGRAIRIGEKAAFFEFTDDLKKTTKDYPIDSIFGRIVGEIHLDHVPVDFTKQDFQRSSQEWQAAVEFLRGTSSLQPRQQGDVPNKSVISKLYQGYRRVRTPGRTDMYMGYWDPEAGPNGGPKRISREKESEYYEKFKARLRGFYDDAEWWKLVEQADQAPLPQLVDCPSCGAQNLQESETCTACQAVLLGKECIDRECRKIIAKSAVSCPHCGKSQIPEIQEPWRCDVCSGANAAGAETCSTCTKPRGTPNPLSRDYLLENAAQDDELTVRGLSIELADRTYSPAIDVEVFVTRGSINTWESSPLPLISFRGERLEIFVDKTHNVFRSFGVRPEFLIASEVAQYLYDSNRRLLSGRHAALHSLPNLQWSILDAVWRERLRESADRIRADTSALVEAVKRRLGVALGESAREIFDELSDGQKSRIVSQLIARGEDLGRLGQIRDSGNFVGLLDNDAVVALFRAFPQKFFDGAVWNVAYESIAGLPATVMMDAQGLLRTRYLNCLEDLLAFEKSPSSDSLTLTRARASLELLSSRMD